MKKLIILMGVFFVSFSAVFVRLADVPSMTLAFYRMGLAWCCMLLPAGLRCRRELRQMRGKTLLLCMTSGMFLGLHFAAYFESLRYTSIGAAVVLTNTEVFLSPWRVSYF